MAVDYSIIGSRLKQARIKAGLTTTRISRENKFINSFY